jgi:DNA-binding Lrp family transcriptional regulator
MIPTNKDENSSRKLSKLDKQDFRIISLLVAGLDNKRISNELGIPLSTVQRRTRNIFQTGIVKIKAIPDFKILGIKKGLIHVYLHDGDIKERAKDMSKMDGFLTSTVHIGNSDIVGEFVYEDSEQLVETISNIKHMHGVDKVVWSEEVYTIPVSEERLLNSFQKMLEKNNYDNKLLRKH